jgi:DNA-binding XRE family transcriptional regulator
VSIKVIELRQYREKLNLTQEELAKVLSAAAANTVAR